MKELKNLINRTKELNSEVEFRYQKLIASSYTKKLLFSMSLMMTNLMVNAQPTNSSSHTPEEAIFRIIIVIAGVVIGRAIFKSKQNKKM
jgi:hypothetical protein